jgi:hypothetical protein
MRLFRWALALTAFALMITGCGTTRVASPSPDLSVNDVSSVEIEYALGHYQHRFTADGHAGNAQVTTYLERNIVEQALVDPAKYASFVAKDIAFSEKPKRAPTEEAECRSPFKVVIKTGEKNTEKTYTSQGCRSSDNDGALSRLVRDGEFLLFSKK